MVQEPTAARLLTLHNVAWLLGLVTRMRAAIRTGGLADLHTELAANWR
jgi:queuine tRNA-ribosyltransferase